MPSYTPANLWVLYIMSTEIVLKYKSFYLHYVSKKLTIKKIF